MMKSVAAKPLRHGFFLTEEELRRIFDCLIQQMKRVTKDSPPVAYFVISYKNGVIAKVESIDEVLSQENVGSSAIQALIIKITDKEEKEGEEPSASIYLGFVKADEEYEDYSMRYRIVGDDRDWVFITSSQLDERLSRIKKIGFNVSLKRHDIGMISFMIIAFSFLFGMLMSMPIRNANLLKTINNIEELYNSHKITDPVKIILTIEKSRTEFESFWYFLNQFYFWIFPCTATFILILLIKYKSLFPLYNFYWGDYISLYDKKQARVKYIVFGIIFALIVAITANYITIKLGIGK